jgi:hypothetical protein
METMVELHLTRQQFMALYHLILERQLDEKLNGPVREWIDVSTGNTVTIEELLEIVSRHF